MQYKPDKAKQLLTEAGYPNGFKTEIVIHPGLIDLTSIVKDYWAKVGVDLTLDVKEFGVYTSIGNTRTHKQMFLSTDQPNTAIYGMHAWRTVNPRNRSMIDDEYINKAW